jgi:hypothetical protein
MRLHGGIADEQVGCDLRVREPARYSAEDVQLPPCQDPQLERYGCSGVVSVSTKFDRKITYSI